MGIYLVYFGPGGRFNHNPFVASQKRLPDDVKCPKKVVRAFKEKSAPGQAHVQTEEWVWRYYDLKM